MENYLLFNAITEVGEKYTCEAVRFDAAASDMEQMRRSIEIEGFTSTIGLLPTAAFPEPERVRDETGNRESFGLTVRADRIDFYADTVRALAYALHTFSKFVRENGGFYTGVYSAFPRFKIRGMIEGFYGKPWTMAQREKAMQVMAENRMNTYIYGPKDDPYHRERWRELYDAEHLQLLQAMIRLCDSCHMDLQYMLAPASTSSMVRRTSARGS